MADEEIDDLVRRLAAAEDRLAIAELEAAYAASFDGREGARWASLFTEDGSYESRGGPAPGDVPPTLVRGTAALAAFCDEAAFSGIHLLCAPELRIDGDRATARVHFTFYSLTEEPATPASSTVVGYYDVAYRRCSDGWRIERRVTTPFARRREWTGGYRPGSGLVP